MKLLLFIELEFYDLLLALVISRFACVLGCPSILTHRVRMFNEYFAV